MAAIFVPPSPQTSFAMSSRRPPLANVPNAANSPHRISNSAALKRARPRSQMDLAFGQPPPKRLVVGPEDIPIGVGMPKPAPQTSATEENKLFSRRERFSQATLFEKRLMAARDQEEGLSQQQQQHQHQHQHARALRQQDKASAEKLDNIRQWQRHYRKAFPNFVFYFDSIPADVRNRSLREVLALGAREERFFSRTVTHVVTSRPIPEVNVHGPVEMAENDHHSFEGPIQTVNPVLLERNDNRRDQGNNTDVLYRARQMGMKIWAMEKLQRMLAAMHEHDTPTTFASGRSGSLNTKGRGETELSQVLRNERMHGPSDRDPSQLMKDLVLFRSPFIYVHDVDEKTRPVMVREYPKVSKRQDGAWPQFRSAPLGKCPFIEEAPSEKELARTKEKRKNDAAAAASVKEYKGTDAEPVPRKDNVGDAVRHDGKSTDVYMNGDNANTPTGPADTLKNFPARSVAPRMKQISHSVKPPLNKIGHWPMTREPAASGVQPSNVTSAIRSQMVSSTAAAPGAKAGLSKEVHELKRKVLQRSNGSMTTSINTSSHRPVDAPMVKTKYGAPASSKRPLEKMGHVQEEDTTQSEDNGSPAISRANNASANPDCRRAPREKSVKEKQRDLKPGYCENCRDKFDDFDEHIMTKKHRKFATTLSNWTELDALLAKLKRPVKGFFDGL